MQQCRRAKDRDMVDDSLIDFAPLITSVLLDNYLQPLPPSLALFEGKQRTPAVSNDNDLPPWKQPAKEKGLDTNAPLHPEWKLRESESYKKVFAGCFIKAKPLFKQHPVCPRYHVLGTCPKSCRHEVSHVPHKELPDKAKKAFSEFCDKCRGK